MFTRLAKMVFILALIGLILATFRYITPTGHLPDKIIDSVAYVKTTLNWVSYSIIDLNVLVNCLFLILTLQMGLLFLKLVLWVISYIG
jgi:hypothetical protein